MGRSTFVIFRDMWPAWSALPFSQTLAAQRELIERIKEALPVSGLAYGMGRDTLFGGIFVKVDLPLEQTLSEVDLIPNLKKERGLLPQVSEEWRSFQGAQRAQRAYYASNGKKVNLDIFVKDWDQAVEEAQLWVQRQARGIEGNLFAKLLTAGMTFFGVIDICQVWKHHPYCVHMQYGTLKPHVEIPLGSQPIAEPEPEPEPESEPEPEPEQESKPEPEPESEPQPEPDLSGIFEQEQVVVVLPEEINCEEWPEDERAFCYERYGAIIEAQEQREERIIQEAAERATEQATLISGGVNLGVPLLVGGLLYAFSPGFRRMVNQNVRRIFKG